MVAGYLHSTPTGYGDGRLRPGARAPRSGRYEFVDEQGRRTGLFRLVTVGTPLPPAPSARGWYVLVAEVPTVYASAASAVVIDKAVRMFPKSMTELAKR